MMQKSHLEFMEWKLWDASQIEDEYFAYIFRAANTQLER